MEARLKGVGMRPFKATPVVCGLALGLLAGCGSSGNTVTTTALRLQLSRRPDGDGCTDGNVLRHCDGHRSPEL